MEKPTLLYASPFPPMQSGISDYSVVLVRALSEKFDITLYTDDYCIQDKALEDYPVLKHGVDEIDFDKFEYIIYNIGNNPDFHSYIYEQCMKHPGMVILHDMVIYFLFVGYYNAKNKLYSKLYQEAGLEKFLEVREMFKERKTDLNVISHIPMNEELLRSGNKIMVHSWYAYNNIIDTGLISEESVRKINLISLDSPEQENRITREKLFEKYKIPQDVTIITSFGNIVETKLNRHVCKAVKAISDNTDRKLCYVMVGSGTAADEYIDGNLIIKTGYTEIDEFQAFIEYSDLIVNLRYPSMGETSAVMVQILKLGKPCITNNGGWFSELPDDCVCKIELDDIVGNLKKVIENFVTNPEERIKLGNSAKEYFQREYSPKVIAQNVYNFLTEDKCE